MNINRQHLLTTLQSVLPGIAPQSGTEQTGCFAFYGGRIGTFNEEVACLGKSSLDKSIKGAVQSKPLLDILSKLPDEEVGVEQTNGSLVITGKGRKTEIHMEAEILLPLDSVERPESWTPIPSELVEALAIVGQCAGNDASIPASTCIHFHPKWIEACDDVQFCRWRMRTGLEKPALVRWEGLKSLKDFAPTEMGDTNNWLHFRNADGAVLSYRKYLEDYANMSKVLADKEGKSVLLPQGLVGAVERAKIFSSENIVGDRILVDLSPGKVRVIGEGVQGRHRESKKVQYDGPSLKFLIAPRLLAEIVSKHSQCKVSAARLRVDAEKYVYVTALGQVDEPKE